MEQNSMQDSDFHLNPIGFIRSTLIDPQLAPRQGDEGGVEAWLELLPFAAPGLAGIQAGDQLLLLTWLHLAQRQVLQVHPRDDLSRPLSGVFATRSQDRPNPIGLHRVRVLAIAPYQLQVAPLEAIDGTPILDIKPILLEAGMAER